MKNLLCLLAFAAFLCMGAVAPAAAAKMQFPESASLGFSFDLPDGWTTQRDDAHQTLLVTIPGAAPAVMVLTVIDDPAETGTIEDVAKAALEVAKVQPYSKVEDVTLSGTAGKRFYSKTTAEGIDFDVRMAVFKIGTTYLTASEITRVALTEEQHGQFGLLGLSITGAR